MLSLPPPDSGNDFKTFLKKRFLIEILVDRRRSLSCEKLGDDDPSVANASHKHFVFNGTVDRARGENH